MFDHNTTTDNNIYICPTCKRPVVRNDKGLHCAVCQVTYPITDGIPDFVLEDLAQSANPLMRWANTNYDRQAYIYERTRYPFRLLLWGEFASPSFDELMRMTASIVEMDEGSILDVGCGPGTLGRRIASPSKAVYGIDISWAMLRYGAAYVRRDQIPNMHFARTKVEELPFQDAQFDAALCGSVLHFFADPELALREIGRTLKADAPLVGITLITTDNSRHWLRRLRDRKLLPPGTHLFQVSALEQMVVQAGYEEFQLQVYGSMVFFNARKGRD